MRARWQTPEDYANRVETLYTRERDRILFALYMAIGERASGKSGAYWLNELEGR